MKSARLILALVVTACLICSKVVAASELPTKTDESNTLWRIIAYPHVNLPEGMGFFLSRQDSGLGLSIAGSEQFLKKGKVAVQLHRPPGQKLQPSSEVSESVVLAGTFGGSWGALVVFPWGSNRLEEAWIEVSTKTRRIWLEIPYGFTRDPKAPTPPPTSNGNARFASAMRGRTGDEKAVHVWEINRFATSPLNVPEAKETILHWANVQYDSIPVQNGWRLSFIKWNTLGDDGASVVELYRESHSWDLHSPRTALRIVEDNDRVMAGRCVSIRLHRDGMRRSDAFDIINMGDDEERRRWGKVEIEVEKKAYSIRLPSSLYDYHHGTTTFESKAW